MRTRGVEASSRVGSLSSAAAARDGQSGSAVLWGSVQVQVGWREHRREKREPWGRRSCEGGWWARRWRSGGWKSVAGSESGGKGLAGGGVYYQRFA